MKKTSNVIFKPIIHNLQESDKGYKEVTLYNLHISRKPSEGKNLQEKIENQRVWKEYCNILLSKVKKVLNDV